jgi:hypothetical protein
MKFIELTDVDTHNSKVMINVDMIVIISVNNRKGFGLRPAGAIIRLKNNEYVRVEEEYNTIKEMFERMK